MKSRKIVLLNQVPRDLQVTAHFNRLEQLIINLISNARDSFEAKQKTKEIKISGSDNGSIVVIECEDSGCGISRELQSRIFEPFVTSKGPEKGTGLGLSICHGIVRDYKGSISLKHSSKNGSCFSIRFPSTRGES